MTRLKFVFLGTSHFGLPALSALIATGHEPLSVYSQPPRPAGRGRKVHSSPIIEAANANNVQLRTPNTLTDAHETRFFASLKPDVVVVAAYGLILPIEILQVPRLGCINIHASLLPRWRGAAPIQRSIMANDAVTGITIMKMDEGLDTGPILAQRQISINSDNAGKLHDRLAALGAEMIVETLEDARTGASTGKMQPESGATYAARLTSKDERLNWDRTADELECQVRALAPGPGAYFMFAGERWKVFSARAISELVKTKSGYVLDDQLTVSCGNGFLQPTELQRPGRKQMPTAEALRGAPIPPGTKLE